MLGNNLMTERCHHARALGLLTNAGRTPSGASHTGHTAESSLQVSSLRDTVEEVCVAKVKRAQVC